MVDDSSLRTIDEVYSARRSLTLLSRAGDRKQTDKVRVEIFVQSAAVTEHLSEGSDGPNRATKLREHLLAFRQDGRPGRMGYELACDLQLWKNFMTKKTARREKGEVQFRNKSFERGLRNVGVGEQVNLSCTVSHGQWQPLSVNLT